MKRCNGSAGFLRSSSPRLQREDQARQEANLQMIKRRSGAAMRMSGKTRENACLYQRTRLLSRRWEKNNQSSHGHV